MGGCEMPKTTYNNIVNVVASSSTNIGVNDQLDRGFRCWHCSTNAEEQNATLATTRGTPSPPWWWCEDRLLPAPPNARCACEL